MGPLSLFLKEVLPMVADIATITSFVILVVTKLTAIPLLFDWLTRLKASRSIRDFFMPPITTLCMNLRMAGRT